jgi:carboxypeptidase C (cathepsin A)
MKQFYQYWPTRTSNPLYIFGVSYGGLYAPLLAWAIHHHNLEVAMNQTSPHINLKGFIVANGVTDYNKDPFIGSVDHLNNFNIMPDHLYNRYNHAGCRLFW